MILSIVKANYISDFKIKIVDLKNYINSKKHPFFKPLREVNEFKKFYVHKTLAWDNRVSIAPEYLHDDM